MSYPLPGERGSQLTLLIRSRSLRHRAAEVLERAAALRERSSRLLRPVPGSAPPVSHADDEKAEEADTLRWYRAQIREMLSAGWSSQELADVGITEALLRELGLHGAE